AAGKMQSVSTPRAVFRPRHLVQADGDCLAQVHRWMLIPGGYAQQPMTIAHIVVGEPILLRAEQEGHFLRWKPLPNYSGCNRQGPQGMLQVAIARGRRPHNQVAIGYSTRDTLVLHCILQQSRRSHGRASFPKSDVVRVYNPQLEETKVAHGASRRPNVQGIAARNQNDAEMIEL